MSAGSQTGKERDDAAKGEAGWDGLKDDVGGLADAALEQGKNFLHSAKSQAKSQVTSFADERKDFAASSVSDFAQSLRQATQGFEDRPNIRAFVDNAAGGLDDLAETIRERSFAEIVGTIEDTMRKRPVTVALTGLALGFLAARFIRSSAEDSRGELARRDREYDEHLRRPARPTASESS